MNYDDIKPLNNLKDLFGLKGRVGLITGGGGKMGEQFAGILSLAGAKLVLADLDQARCDKVVSTVQRKTKGKLWGMGCDISKEEKVSHLFDFIEKKFGRLDFFISNVMAKPNDYYKPFEKYSKTTWEKVIEINLTGSFLCCQRASDIMKKQKSGSIILTSSIYGVVGPDQRIYDSCSGDKNPYGGSDKLNAPGAYSASKGGLIALGRYLATLLGEHNIRVNVLTPGGVFDGHEPAFHDAYVNKVPLKRMGTWTDYNGAVLFLASDASRYMTGSNLIVDGGWSAW